MSSLVRADDQPVPGRQWARLFPWSAPAAIFLLGVLVGAVAATALFSPAVGVREIQRRDRLPPAGQFVDFTYRYFLGRPADDAGLAEYQALFERDGAESVALAIISAREFRDKHADGKPLSGLESLNPTEIATRYAQLYNSGALQPPAAPDAPGKVGFVVLLMATAIVLVCFQRFSARGLAGAALHTYIPRSYIISSFTVLAVMWWLYTQFSLSSFAPGALGYTEWLERVTNLAIGRGPTTVWTPYPQGTQMVLVVLETIASTVSGWLRSDVWTSYTLFRTLFQSVFLLIPSIVLVSVVHRLGMLMSPASATFATLVVAFSFAPIYFGLATTYVSDPLPVALTVLAVWFFARQHMAWAGVAVGLGAALKLIPLVAILPLVVLAATGRSRWRVLVCAIGVLLCILGPFALANFDIFLSPFRWQSGRPAWESWYAFADWLAGAPHEYMSPVYEDLSVRHDFGWVFTGITPTLTVLASPVPVSALRWENVVSGIGTVLSLLAIGSAKSATPRSIVRWSMYALAVTFFWNIGWSPQYELYLIPLIALAFETPLVAIGAVLALELLTFLEYPLLLPWAYFYGGSAVWLAWAAILARYLVLGWLALFVLRSEFRVGMFRTRLRDLTSVIWLRRAVRPESAGV